MAASRAGREGIVGDFSGMRTVFAFVLLFASSFCHAQNERLVPALGALERGDVKQAIESLKPLATTGDIEAQYTLATVLENAKPPLQDLEGARQWYERAAEGGNANAQNNLAAMHFDGRGAIRDYVEAARLYRLAADQGNPTA